MSGSGKTTPSSISAEQAPLVIGIGASAGGLEALQQFFSCMPPNSGLSFVVVQHLSPDYKSLMADILSKHTEMPVYQAENGMAVEGDTVYLIPPKKFMTIKDGKLILTDYTAVTLNHPIDIFFSSLAEEKKEQSYFRAVYTGGFSGNCRGNMVYNRNGRQISVFGFPISNKNRNNVTYIYRLFLVLCERETSDIL